MSSPLQTFEKPGRMTSRRRNSKSPCYVSYEQTVHKEASDTCLLTLRKGRKSRSRLRCLEMPGGWCTWLAQPPVENEGNLARGIVVSQRWLQHVHANRHNCATALGVAHADANFDITLQQPSRPPRPPLPATTCNRNRSSPVALGLLELELFLPQKPYTG